MAGMEKKEDVTKKQTTENSQGGAKPTFPFAWKKKKLSSCFPEKNGHNVTTMVPGSKAFELGLGFPGNVGYVS